MKILALVTEAFGGKGGIAQANRDLLTALRREHAVTVLPRRSAGESEERAPGPGRMAYAAAAVRLASSTKYDLIFCGHFYMASLAGLLAAFFRVRLWIHLHGIEAWQCPSRHNKLTRAAVRRAALITAVSRYTRRRFLAWSDLAPDRVRVLPDTYDPRFTPQGGSGALIERWGLRGKKIILTVGRLSSQEKYKGHDRIIKVMPRLVQRHPDACYVVAGEGDDRKRLEALAAASGLGDAVRFTGAVQDSELPELYRMASVFAMPSTGEGFGIVFLEAAACGVPVVAGNADGSVDALRDGRLGRLIDPYSSDETFASLDEALSGAALTAPGEADWFSRDRMTLHLSALLKETG